MEQLSRFLKSLVVLLGHFWGTQLQRGSLALIKRCAFFSFLIGFTVAYAYRFHFLIAFAFRFCSLLLTASESRLMYKITAALSICHFKLKLRVV